MKLERSTMPVLMTVLRTVLTTVLTTVVVGMLESAAMAADPVAVDSETAQGFETLSPAIVATATALRDQALEDDHAYAFVESLTTEVGPRLAGSAGDRRAVAWAKRQLESWGFAKVWTEPVTVPHWRRGHAIGRIVAPYPQPVVLAALGGSVGTVAGGIEAEVFRVTGLAALGAADADAIAGKIVFIDEPMARTRDGQGYGAAVGKRVVGPSMAAAKGAVALVIRSAGTSTGRIAHTGTLRYSDDQPKIPAAALSNADADLLAAQIERGKPVRFHLDLGCEDLPEEQSANVIAEVRGREKPDEIVLLVAHLDSWDLGTGAVDDGAGCATVAGALRLIAGLPTAPRRTIRVLLTANEEFGLSGARAYAEKHADAFDAHVAGLESDIGAAAVWAFRARVPEPAQPLVRDLARLVEPLGIETIEGEARGGADLRFLVAAGMPVFDLAQDARPYFDVHHTAADTLDKVDPANLRQNVAAYATAAYVLAETEIELGRLPAAEE